MTSVEACLRLVEELPGSLVEALIRQLRGNVTAAMPNPGYQSRVEEFLRSADGMRGSLPSMLEVALAAKRAVPTVELVWTGPATSVVPVRRTEQVLFELIRCADMSLTITSLGVFQIPRLVEELEACLARRVRLRIVLGDREARREQELERNRRELGPIVAAGASLLQWPPERRPRDEQGRAGLMHVKAAVADSHIAFLTSANLTEPAMERNMELGVMIRGGAIPRSIDRLIDAMVESGELALV